MAQDTDGIWVVGGLVSVIFIGMARRLLDEYQRLPTRLRESGWKGRVFDLYAWWEGWDI